MEGFVYLYRLVLCDIDCYQQNQDTEAKQEEMLESKFS